MDEVQLLEKMQRYVANIAITNSALRNQGAPGMVDAARKFVSGLDLRQFQSLDMDDYTERLDALTRDLASSFPEGAQNWGSARKAINIFMVQSTMNRFLAGPCGLANLDELLEVPLDGNVSWALRKSAGRGVLPRWTSIVKLTPEDNGAYQAFAMQLAGEYGIRRFQLDALFWRAKNI